MSDPSLRPSRTSSGRELRRTFYLAALAWTVLAILLWAWIPTPASLAIAWALGLATVLLAGRGLSLREDERTRILADLAAERERLTSTLRGTSAATWEWNVETGDLVLDERWAEMLGYRLADLQPTSFETFGSRLHPDDLPRTLELVELHFADPEVMFESEFRLRHADGTWVWILGRGKLLSRTAAGEPLRMGGTHQEIGERRRLADELEASRALLETIFHQAPIAMAYAMADGDMQLNAASRRLLDELDADAVERASNVHDNYRTWRTFLADGTELDESRRPLLTALQGQVIRDEEVRVVQRDGTERWVTVNAGPIRGADGSLVAAFESLQDTTERRRLTQELDASRALLEAFFQQAPIAMAYATTDGSMQLNAASERLLRELDGDIEEAPENLTGDFRTWRIYRADGVELGPDENPLQLALGGETLDAQEFRVMTRDGKERWVVVHAAPLQDDRGCRVAAFEAVQDVTEQHRLTLDLAESRALLQALFDQAPIPITCAMADGTLVVNGASAEHLKKLDPDLPPRQPGAQLGEIPVTWSVLDEAGEPIPREDLPLARALRGETTRGMEARVRLKDGTELWETANASPIYNEDGELIAAFEVYLDVTDEKRAAQEKLELERRVLHAQKLESLGVLAGGIAHDFNNLLMAILGNADLALAEVPSGTRLRDKLEEIERASKSAAALAKQMLAYSGRGHFVVEAVDLGELVEEMVSLLKVSISKKAELRLELARDLPRIQGDRTQLRQVVMNLITNASESLGDEGGVISLSTRVQACDRALLDATVDGAAGEGRLAEGDYLVLEVRDTGEGMDEATCQRIFDPFFTTKFTGRGLGMSAVLGILRGHRGSLIVESSPGRGSTFRVLLPIDGRLGFVAEPAVAPGHAEAAGQVPGERGSILVVDDEEGVRAVVERMLERLGYETMTAEDGEQALELLTSAGRLPRAVLLDLTMPRMDGAETLGHLRAGWPELPVVLCSGFDRQDAMTSVDGLEAAAFLQKPFGVDALGAALGVALAGRASAGDNPDLLKVRGPRA